MGKCVKKFDELNDKTDDLESTVQTLRLLTSEIIKRQHQSTKTPVIPKHA